MSARVGWCRAVATAARVAAHPAYRVGWGVAALVVGVAAAWAATTQQTTSTAVVTALAVLVMCGWTVAIGAIALEIPVRRSLGTVVAVAVGILTITGFALLVQGWALLVVGVLGLSAPRAVRVAARLEIGDVDPRPGRDGAEGSTLRALAATRAWRHAEPDDAAGEPAAPTEVGRLSTRALCLWWRVSGLELAATRDPARVQALAQLRAAVLDELGDRDPAALSRWLRSREVEPDPTAWFAPGGAARPGAVAPEGWDR